MLVVGQADDSDSPANRRAALDPRQGGPVLPAHERHPPGRLGEAGAEPEHRGAVHARRRDGEGGARATRAWASFRDGSPPKRGRSPLAHGIDAAKAPTAPGRRPVLGRDQPQALAPAGLRARPADGDRRAARRRARVRARGEGAGAGARGGRAAGRVQSRSQGVVRRIRIARAMAKLQQAKNTRSKRRRWRRPLELLERLPVPMFVEGRDGRCLGRQRGVGGALRRSSASASSARACASFIRRIPRSPRSTRSRTASCGRSPARRATTSRSSRPTAAGARRSTTSRPFRRAPSPPGWWARSSTSPRASAPKLRCARARSASARWSTRRTKACWSTTAGSSSSR